MVDVRNALNGYNKNNRYRKYPENIERFNEKIMGSSSAQNMVQIDLLKS